jgi:hypothetical protein
MIRGERFTLSQETTDHGKAQQVKDDDTANKLAKIRTIDNTKCS